MRRISMAAAALLAVAGLTACGSGGSGGSSDAFTSQSVADIKKDVETDMRGLDSAKISGSVMSSGEQITIDLSEDTDGNCTGTMGIKGGKAQILMTGGKGWMKPDDDMWTAMGVQPDQVDAIVGDKWVVLPSDSADLAQLCDLDKFLDQVFKDDPSETGMTEKGKTSQLDGQEVLELSGKAKDGGETKAYVTTGDKHYIVKFEKAGTDGGSITFSNFDDPVDAKAPAESDQLDLNSLGG